MPGVHRQTGSTRIHRGAHAVGQGGGIGAGARLRVGTGVDLDALGAKRRDLRTPSGAGVDKQADTGAGRAQAGNDWPQPIGITGDIEAMVGGDLAIAIRDQRDLGRARAFHDLQQARVALIVGPGERVALDVELDLEQRRKRGDIGWADMTQVRARMHGDAIGTRGHGHPRRLQNVRQGAAA